MFSRHGRPLTSTTSRALLPRLHLGSHPPSPRTVLLPNHPSIPLATPRTHRLSPSTPRAPRPWAQPQGAGLGRLLRPLRIPQTPVGRPRPQSPRLHRLGSVRGCRYSREDSIGCSLPPQRPFRPIRRLPSSRTSSQRHPHHFGLLNPQPHGSRRGDNEGSVDWRRSVEAIRIGRSSR